MNRLQYFLMNLVFSPVYDSTDTPVCYASQTGTAANLAKQSGETIQGQGKTVTVSSLSQLQPADLDRYQQVLMIVSTCGEGEIPDDGLAFYDQLQTHPALKTSVALLALGDKSYKHFCTAGQLFHDELLRMGAAVDEQPVLVDGNPLTVWQQWLNEQLDEAVDSSDLQETEKELTMNLLENRPLHQALNKESCEGNQAHRLVFKIDEEEAFQYQVGDLIGITPPGDNRERLYSIASGPSVKENQVELCVGLLSYEKDGNTQFGQCSQYLIQSLQAGETIKARWKAGGGLALPKPDQPLIMVATGAGIAPMMCLMQERICQQHPANNWLLFGNRKASEDFYYRQELEAMLGSGELKHLDTAFSRDTDKKVYIQDVLEQHQDRLAQWLLEDNACLYVCGRTDLKPAVMSVVEQALTIKLPDPQAVDKKLEELQSNGQVVFELF